ncbi:MAG: putative methionine-R-sulfoxide reductase with GAF domain, partial [Roseivirga sp.]
MREKSPNERKAHFLETINAFGSILMRTSTTQESVWCAAKHAVGELGYIDCVIYLINDDGELYQCAAHGNKNPNAQIVLNPLKLKIGVGICGHVALTGVGEIIADTSKEPRYIEDDERRNSEITVPILSDGIVIGIIDSEHPERGYFSDHDLNILNTIASMLSFKISQAKAIEELAIINKELADQNEEKQKRTDELALANTELAFQNEEKQKRADELALANTELAFQNKEKEKRADELALANTELAFQNEEKEKRADELALANTELAFQNKEKEKRADELALANTELAFQNKEKEKRTDELALANTELAFQSEEKEKRADELALANTELA